MREEQNSLPASECKDKINGIMNKSGDKPCALLTGGAGYIGNHTAIEMVKAGYQVVIVDNLHNSYMEAIRRIEEILGQKLTIYVEDLLDKAALHQVFSKEYKTLMNKLLRPGEDDTESVTAVEELAGLRKDSIPRYKVDIVDYKNMQSIFQKHKFDCVIHFAGLKAVGESVEKPLLYYKNNIKGTINLLEVMREFGVYNLVFSSSATVYGNPQYLPLDEKHPTGACSNPYGRTKYMIEEILRDLAASEKAWNIICLRYFNPVGAHESGRIGEDPQGIPNNLMPFISQVAVKRREHLNVFGGDYDTHDGTGVRDYIHVVDLAIGHVRATEKLKENCGFQVYNLGTGTGYSVLDMVKAFEKASGQKIPYKIVGRRSGDVAACYADPSLAAKELNWRAERGLDAMCADSWRWQSMNPYGFKQEKK